MSRHRGDWDDDFYEGEPRPRRERGGPDFGGPPRPGYEYDERVQRIYDRAKSARGVLSEEEVRQLV